jgi:hypothetical protein
MSVWFDILIKCYSIAQLEFKLMLLIIISSLEVTEQIFSVQNGLVWFIRESNKVIIDILGNKLRKIYRNLTF